MNLIGFAQTEDCYSIEIYNDFIAKGQKLVDEGDYVQAMQYYNSAKDYCKAKSKSVDSLMQEMVITIKNEQQKTQEALDQAEKLINAFYFAFDKFALAYKDDKFYFIDKKGDPVSKLGKWDKAEQFDEYYRVGLAKVEKEGITYYLDTLGNEYRVAYSIEGLSPEITALDLSEQQFNEFPIEVLSYPNLQVLIINGEVILDGEDKENNFPSLPPEISQLKNLKFLSLRYCNIQELPESIGQLQNLQTLDLYENQLSTLPESFGQLQNLKYLSLLGCKIQELPESFGQLQNLKYLSLLGCKIQELPESFGQLQNLQELDLGGNQLNTLPESITKLQNLKYLSLLGCKIQELPESFGQLQNLKYLSLLSCKIQELPESFGQLQNLQHLNLAWNDLSTLPESFGQLQNLQVLNLEYNQLSVLPESIGNLQNLQALNLEYNQLSVLPESIGNLQKLWGLALEGNPISEEEIKRINKLLPNRYIRF